MNIDIDDYADPSLQDVRKYLREHSQSEDTIEAYNTYIRKGLQKQLYASKVSYRSDNKDYDLYYKIKHIIPPFYRGYDEKQHILYPSHAKNLGLSYNAWIYVQPVAYEAGTNKNPIYGTTVLLSKILVMVKSILCHLSKTTDREELELLGENPDDPGGYYIYNGNITVIPGTEKIRINRVTIVPPGKKSTSIRAAMTVNVPTGTAMNYIVERKIEGFEKKLFNSIRSCHFCTNKMKISQDTSSRDYKGLNSINVLNLIDIICSAFRREDLLRNEEEHHAVSIILGFICTKDDELRSKQIKDVRKYLQGTIQEYKYGAETTQCVSDLLTWLGVNPLTSPNVQKRDVLVSFIQEQVFGSVKIKVKTRQDGTRYYAVEDKIRSICFLTSQFLLHKAGYLKFTDKDTWDIRKVDTGIVGMSQEFWRTYHKTIKEPVLDLHSPQNKKGIDSVIPITAAISQIFTNAFLLPFRTTSQEGTTGSAFEPSQTVNPTNLVHLIDEITKLQVKVDKKVKSQGLRNIQGTQAYFLCLGRVQDGIKSGIAKRKTLGSHYSIEQDPGILIRLLYSLELVYENKTQRHRNILFVNGVIIGWCDGEFVLQQLKRMRQGSPQAFEISENGNDFIVEPKWYPFDVYRRILFVISEIGQKIEPNTVASVRNGYKYNLYIGEKFLGKISKKACTALAKESSIPRIHQDTCFVLNEFGHLNIHTDSGRLLRFVYIVRDNRAFLSRFPNEKLPELELLVDNPRYHTENLSFEEMRERGFIEYIDPYEESHENFYHVVGRDGFYKAIEDDKADIEQYLQVEKEYESYRSRFDFLEEEELQYFNELSKKYEMHLRRFKVIKSSTISHVTPHGILMYGASAALAPLSHHDPAAKTVHTAKIIPQTLGLNQYGYLHSKKYYQLSSNIPLNRTSLSTFVGNHRSFLGKDISIGFVDMPENQEDAILVSSNFAELQDAQYVREFAITANIQVSGASRYLGIPKNLSQKEMPKYLHLTEYGVPPIGYELREGEIAISTYKSDKEKGIDIPMPILAKTNEAGKVIDILIFAVDDRTSEIPVELKVSVLVRAFYSPEKGDKIGLMHGQKFVIGGKYIAAEDMLFDIFGNSPMIMANTHAMKNRQTIGVFLEMLLGIKAVCFSKTYDSTGFTQYDFERLCNELEKEGYFFKKTMFFNAKTGRSFYGRTFTGYVTFQQLHHFAHEKIKITGMRDTTGMKSGSSKGEKYGEQEKSSINAYGASWYFNEKFTRSDKLICYSCTSCDNLCNRFLENCPYCGASQTFLLVEITKGYKHLQDVGLAQNMRIRSHFVTEETLAKSLIESDESWYSDVTKYQNVLSPEDIEIEELNQQT